MCPFSHASRCQRSDQGRGRGSDLGAEDKGKELKRSHEEEIREVRDKVSHLSPEERPAVSPPLAPCLWTAGKDTFNGVSWGQNAFADLSGYVIVDLEELIRRNPDII